MSEEKEKASAWRTV